MSQTPIGPKEVDQAIAELVGLPSVGRHRAADMEMFGFGMLREGNDLHGRPTVRPTYSVHVQAPWRIFRDGRIVVGYEDMRDPPLGVSRHGWDPNEAPVTHRDELLRAYFDESRARHVTVAKVERTGDLLIAFDDGSELQVVPDSVAIDNEHWRLIRPDGSHVVIGGNGASLSAG